MEEIELGSQNDTVALSLHEVHFVPLRAQSTVYCLVPLLVEGRTKLVVSTIRGEISYLEFHNPSAQRPPGFTPINFTYIPVDAEVISIDILTKEPHGVIVGVTLIKTDSDPKEVYFNLYGIHCDPALPLQWEKVAEDWHPLTLKFIPFQLTHTKVLTGDKWESVFLLAGDDHCIHLYRESLLPELSFAEELSSDLFFPEFRGLPSSITSLDMKVAGTQRLTVFGCQNGFLQCSLVDITAGKVLHCWTSDIVDGPITSINLFTLSSRESPPSADREDVELLQLYHVVLSSAVELGVVFMNVLEKGFLEAVVLPSSQQHDSVLCTCVADMNWDGVNELVLGTFGRQVLVYQFVTVQDGQVSIPHFRLIWSKAFAHPIHRVWYGDVTHDGLSELVVVSAGGVHIMQHDMEQATLVCKQRLEQSLVIS